MISEKDMLDLSFGADSTGDTPAERVRTSHKRFVRSLFQIAEDSPKATGRRLSAWEVYTAYGPDVLAEIGAEGYSVLATGPKVAGEAIAQRISDLELPPKYVADSANVPLPTLERMLDADPEIALRLYERVAQVIGLDERRVGVQPEPAGNEALTVRLRTIGRESARLTPFAVSGISEAAWVASTQVRLETELGLRNVYRDRFRPSPNYGAPGYPAYLHGYFLAKQTRDALGLERRPISSLRELSEEILGVPIIQTDLGGRIAGVTVDTGTTRAIVLSLGGQNRTPFVRRSTVAHELGHLLYDPTEKLNHLRVDDYDDLDMRFEEVRDPVEQRANAFCAELIAPQQAVAEIFEAHGGDTADRLAAVVATFGISFTAAAHQISNALNRSILPPTAGTSRLTMEQVQRWEAAEAYSVDMHPLRTLRWSRRGRFSAVVLRAADAGVISWDTAALYLESEQSDVREAVEPIRDLFPSVFRGS